MNVLGCVGFFLVLGLVCFLYYKNKKKKEGETYKKGGSPKGPKSDWEGQIRR